MNVLQEVELFIVSDPECEAVHGGDPHPSNICAGVLGGGKGHCSVKSFFFLAISHWQIHNM